jgi:uncharacterized protein (UPF0335 family)
MKKILLAGFLALLLTGCATAQKPVSLSPSFWENRQQTVAVAVTTSTPPTATMLGQQGLLDIIVNRGNAKSLIEFLEKMEIARLKNVAKEFADQLTARGFRVKTIEEPIDVSKLDKFSGSEGGDISFAKLDFRKFKADDADKLVVISINRVGTVRNYYGFIPLDAPQADLSLTGQMVDLSNNQLLWYTVENKTMPIPEPWDQAPTFENVSGAVLANVDQGLESFQQSFFAGPVQ